MQYSPYLKLMLLDNFQIEKETIINSNFYNMSNILVGGIKSRKVNIPPKENKEGDKYIVTKNALGPWKDMYNKVAVYSNNEWLFIEYPEGSIFWILDERKMLVFEQNNWNECY